MYRRVLIGYDRLTVVFSTRTGLGVLSIPTREPSKRRCVRLQQESLMLLISSFHDDCPNEIGPTFTTQHPTPPCPLCLSFPNSSERLAPTWAILRNGVLCPNMEWDCEVMNGVQTVIGDVSGKIQRYGGPSTGMEFCCTVQLAHFLRLWFY